jgi:precorrin-3B synthase
MMTGDGLLARIALTDALSPAQLADICRLALKHGNGMIDISSRGTLQIRGLTETSAHLLAAAAEGLNLPLRDGLAVEVPPLAGLDPTEMADPRPLADAIRKAAVDVHGLAPKMTVVVDGGGQLRLSNLLADVRLVALGDDHWKLLLGGTEASGRVHSVLRETSAVDAVLDLLDQLAVLGSKARGRDLAEGLPGNSSFGMAASPFAVFALEGDMHAVGVGPAFGQTRAEHLIALCREAAQIGIEAVKPSLEHCLLFFGMKEQCLALRKLADAQQFITRADDPRSHIAACTGSPACTSAIISSHDIAARAAEECAALLDGSFKLHITGCAKGCAHPQASALSICGTAAGVSMVVQGKAADAPFASIAFADTNAALRRISHLVGSDQYDGETSAACLRRLGPERLSAAIGQQ